MIPASSGDQARKVILFLQRVSAAPVLGVQDVRKDSIPGTLARGQLVLDVVDCVPGTLADSALQR